MTTIPGRLGRYAPERAGDPASRGGLWLHAVSVGEVGVAATLARALPPSLPLVVTTVTPTGQERARSQLGHRAAVEYLPFEFGFAVRRFFDRFEPRTLVLVEGDYWPLVLREARRRGVPVAVVNGRVSDRSFPRLSRWIRRFPGLRRLFFAGVERFGVQTAADRDRLLALGIDAARVVVTGNLKYETPEPAEKPDLAATVARLAQGRPVLVAGSIMAGEEDEVITAFRPLAPGRRALLLLAPRHPQAFGAVYRRLVAEGWSVARRSETSAAEESADVLLLDTLGELAFAYSLAAGAFIGGTLLPTGGHNPLEAARYGVPVVVGPSMENFREMADHFDAAQAWRRVSTAEELGATWNNWLDHPEAAQELGQRGRALLEANRGAMANTLAMLAPLLGEG